MRLADKLQPIVNKVAIQIKQENPNMSDIEAGQLAKDIVKQMSIELSQSIIEVAN